MVNVKAHVYSLLTAHLVDSLAGCTITPEFPDNFNQTFPVIAYSESNQASTLFYDNQPIGVESTVDIHLFTPYEVNTQSLAQAIDAILIPDFYTCILNAESDDPRVKARHRVMRYRRTLRNIEV